MLSMRGMLLVIEPSPYTRVPFYSGLGYDHQFINKQDARTRKKKKDSLRVENKIE